MSFLDKVTKAVGDVVDRGKKDVDQFMKIQKINSEIGGMEKKIAGFRTQIDTARQEAGARAIEMLRAGTLTSPELQTFLDQVIGFEQQIAAEETNIAGKRADIERIKAEHAAEHVAAAAPAPPPAEPERAAPPPIPAAPPVPPVPAAAGKVCTQCGAELTGGAFCPQCGAKLA